MGINMELTRRNFLKLSAAVSLVAAVPALAQAPAFGVGIPAMPAVKAAQSALSESARAIEGRILAQAVPRAILFDDDAYMKDYVEAAGRSMRLTKENIRYRLLKGETVTFRRPQCY